MSKWSAKFKRITYISWLYYVEKQLHNLCFWQINGKVANLDWASEPDVTAPPDRETLSGQKIRRSAAQRWVCKKTAQGTQCDPCE